MILDPLETPKPATTETKVISWRLENLLRAGYDLGAAEEIAARRDIDLHQAAELVAVRGCAPATAARILL